MSDPRRYDMVMGALCRRETWSSKYVAHIIARRLLIYILCYREEAIASFKEKSFFKRWDPEVLENYVEFGLYNTTDREGRPAAMLKMPALQEAIVFAATLTQYETYQRLLNLDERIELRWVVPGRPGEE